MTIGAVISMTLALALPSAVQDPELTLDQTITCAAMLFAWSQVEPDPEAVEAFENGTGRLVLRAAAMAPDSPRDQIIDRVSREEVALTDRIAGVPTMPAKRQLVWTHGPGMALCLQAATTD
jgi:hypothetical protein